MYLNRQTGSVKRCMTLCVLTVLTLALLHHMINIDPINTNINKTVQGMHTQLIRKHPDSDKDQHRLIHHVDKPMNITTRVTQRNIEIPIGVLAQLYRHRVDANKTKTYIMGNKTIFNLGDVVKLRITLYDSEGTRRHIGGDILLVRIFEAELQASASGHVVDHVNGSYTAMVKCLWVGRPTIRIYLANTKEVIDLTETVISQTPAIRVTHVVYNDEDRGLCHPFKTRLIQDGAPDRPLCNMTKINGGMSWYCTPPTGEGVNCSDVKYFGYGPMDLYHKLELMYTIIVDRVGLGHAFTVQVKGTTDTQAVIHPSSTPCNVYNRTKLWTLPSPVGYFYHNKWTLLHCTSAPPSTFKSCLQDRHIVLYGDSTVRQWFLELKDKFDCFLTSEEWTIERWSMDSTLYCPGINLTVDMVFHSLPGNIDPLKVKFSSVSRHILKSNFHNGTILLICIQNHFDGYDLNVFRHRIYHIRKSLDTVLRERTDLTILIKGGQRSSTKNDYRSVLYRRIITREFHGLLDKVVYLDHMDMTLASLIKVTHPPSEIVRTMVDQMLGYVC